MAGRFKGAFLDRDGVINEDHGYVHRIEDFHFIDGIFEACRALNALDYRIVIVTNQSGIGRGYFSEADFQTLNRWMLERFEEAGARIAGVYYCPYHPDGRGDYKRNSSHRKPGPGMLLDALAEHDIDPRRSFVAGDNVRDIEAGRAAGIERCYLIGNPVPGAAGGVRVYDSLFDLVQAEFAAEHGGLPEIFKQ